MRGLLILFVVALLPGCQEARSPSAVPAAQASSLGRSASAPPIVTPAKLTRSDFEGHVARLKKRLPSNDFSIVIQEPFVVVGDEEEVMVKQRAENTVKWAVDRLKQDFFTQDPEQILRSEEHTSELQSQSNLV